jgi:hypothetical protein
MERRSREQVASDGPIADVPQSGEVAVTSSHGSVRIARRELFDGVRPLEGACRQRSEFLRQHGQVADHRRAALERLDVDVALAIELQQIRDGRRPAVVARRLRRDAWILAGRDLCEELRFPDHLGFMLGCDSGGGAARKGEVVHRHPVAFAAVHHVDPPRMCTTWTASAALTAALFQNGHTRSSFRVTRLWSARRAESNPSRPPSETSFL